MTRLVLDSGGLSHLSQPRRRTAALIEVFKRDEIWPPIVPSVVLVESLTGQQHTDAAVNWFLKTCTVMEQLTSELARRAGSLRRQARRGSAVDAIVVAVAEPDGTVLTGDLDDLLALAQFSRGVRVVRI